MKIDRWLRKYLPKSLLGRSILIFIIPILLIQLIMTIIFIDRLYGDVTIAKTLDVAREVNYVLDGNDGASDLEEIQSKAGPLALTVKMGSLENTEDIKGTYDLSGGFIFDTLRKEIPSVQAIDLKTNDEFVVLEVMYNNAPYLVSFSRNRASAKNPHQLLVATTLAALLLIAVSLLFLKNQVRPIKSLARVAEEFGKGRKRQFSPSGAAEVRRAGHAFISMQSRIESQIEQRTTMLSGVSHDLRTPLTRMKLSLSLLDPSEDIDALKGDVDEMENIVNEFLAFSKGDSGERITRINPKAFVKSIVKERKRMNHKVDLIFDGIVDQEVILKCRELGLKRALTNLMDNARKFGENTSLTVTVGNRQITFCVEDDGPGIAKDIREEAVKPFERLDSSRNQNNGVGTGLGLAIAADVARSHGGQLSLAHSQKLGGLKAEISIPR